MRLVAALAIAGIVLLTHLTISAHSTVRAGFDRCPIVGVYWDNIALECVAGWEDAPYAAVRRAEGHGALNYERIYGRTDGR